MGDFEVAQIERCCHRRQSIQGRLKRWRIVGEADKQHALKIDQVNRIQTMRCRLETFRHEAPAAQRAIQTVSPGVIGAGKRTRLAGTLETDPRAAMPADIQIELERHLPRPEPR